MPLNPLAFNRDDFKQINNLLWLGCELLQGNSHSKAPGYLILQNLRAGGHLRSLGKRTALRVLRAKNHVVVNHTGSLHEGINNGGANKGKTGAFERS